DPVSGLGKDPAKKKKERLSTLLSKKQTRRVRRVLHRAFQAAFAESELAPSRKAQPLPRQLWHRQGDSRFPQVARSLPRSMLRLHREWILRLARRSQAGHEPLGYRQLRISRYEFFVAWSVLRVAS